MSRQFLALAVGVVLLLASCADSETGRARATTSTASAKSATTKAATTAPRPRDYDLSSVDPCALIPQQARPGLDIGQAPAGPTAVSGMSGVMRCVFSVQTVNSTGGYYSYGVFLYSGQGADDFLATADGTDSRDVKTTVGGFAVTTSPDSGTKTCFAVVDTGDGQNMSIQTNATSQVDLTQLCQMTLPVVQIALSELAQLQP